MIKRFEKIIPYTRWIIQVSETVFLGLLIFAAFLTVLHQILSITYRYPLDYGEAPLVDQALRLANGLPIYRSELSSPPYTISNYPPIYLLCLAPFEKIFGANFWSGRLISTLCAWATAWFLGLILWNKTRDRKAAIAAGLVFMAFPYVVQWSSYARIDHLALLLSISGLYYLTQDIQDRKKFALGAGLLTAAIFTRQSYALAVPLTAFTWWLFKDWRRAFLLAGLVGGISVIAFLVINLLTNNGFFFNIITANVNEFARDRLLWNLESLWGLSRILIIVGVSSIIFFPRQTRLWLLTGTFLLGAAASSLTIGKIGSNVNYFLELCAALSLGMGSIFAWSRSSGKFAMVRLVITAVMVFQVVGFVDKTLDEKVAALRDRRAAWSQLLQLEEVINQSNGPVLADEYMGLVTLNHRYLYIQPFEVTQLAWAGIWDQSPLLQEIRNQEFPIILIHYFSFYDVYKERWTQEMLSTIDEYYQETSRLADTAVYQPKSEP